METRSLSVQAAPLHFSDLVPQEIVDRIIDFSQDLTVLSNHSLVDRSWLHSSRRHLFNNVRVQLNTVSAFVRLLQDPKTLLQPNTIRGLSLSTNIEPTIHEFHHEFVVLSKTLTSVRYLRLGGRRVCSLSFLLLFIEAWRESLTHVVVLAHTIPDSDAVSLLSALFSLPFLSHLSLVPGDWGDTGQRFFERQLSVCSNNPRSRLRSLSIINPTKTPTWGRLLYNAPAPLEHLILLTSKSVPWIPTSAVATTAHTQLIHKIKSLSIPYHDFDGIIPSYHQPNLRLLAITGFGNTFDTNVGVRARSSKLKAILLSMKYPSTLEVLVISSVDFASWTEWSDLLDIFTSERFPKLELLCIVYEPFSMRAYVNIEEQFQRSPVAERIRFWSTYEWVKASALRCIPWQMLRETPIFGFEENPRERPY